MSIPYQSGSAAVATSANYMDFYKYLKEQRDDKLKYPLGNQRLSDLTDLFMDRKVTEALAYISYERLRNMPKIKATNGGAGAAGASVTFTLDSSAVITVPYNSPDPPYVTATTSTLKGLPVRVNDVIQIKPGSGVAASGNYIYAKVTTVTASSGEFTAVPLDPAESIPSIPSADEIIILYNEIGDGGGLPAPDSLKVAEYRNSLNQCGSRAEITDHASASRKWFTDASGKNTAWTPAEIMEYTDMALNRRELMALLGKRAVNTTLTNASAAAGTPLIGGQGLIPELLDRANIFEYSSVTGPTYAYLRNIARVLQAQKGSTHNMFLVGHQLRSDLNKMNLNELQGGVINIGNFRGDEDKFVSLSFKRIEVDGYYLDLKTMPSFSDLQTLGAAGYGYTHEGMIIPERNVIDKDGKSTTAIRARYATNHKGEDMSLQSTYWDGFKYSENGNGREEIRFKSMFGIELIGGNQCGYVRRSQG